MTPKGKSAGAILPDPTSYVVPFCFGVTSHAILAAIVADGWSLLAMPIRCIFQLFNN